MKSINSLKNYIHKFGAALLSLILVLIITQDVLFTIKPLDRLENKFIDTRFQKRGIINFHDSSDVIILEITQDSYDQIPSPYNSWPWPRSLFAKVIKNLNEAGATAIGIDLVMSNSDKFSPKNDSLLFSTMQKYKNIVVAGKVDVEQESAAEKAENGFTQKSVLRKTEENFSNIFFEADSSIGIVQAIADNDGIYRRYVPYVYSILYKMKIPTFAYSLLNQYYNLSSFYTAQNITDFYIYNSVKIPKNREESFYINFYGPNGTFPRVKFIDVLDDSTFNTTDELELNTQINTWDNPDYGLKYSGIFKNKIVLIGSTMPEDKDLIPVSFSEGNRDGDNLMYGVEFHANAVQNFLDRNFIKSSSQTFTIAIIILLTFFVFYLTTFIKQLKIKHTIVLELSNIFLLLVVIFIIYQLSIFLFEKYNYILPIVSPSLAIIFGYFGSTIFEFFNERKKNVLIKGMFSQYVSKALVNELLNNPDKLKLGGESKNLTILFTDIEGFTSFAENKSPETVVNFVNEFLGEMTEIILKYDGTLDKYLGDSVMAFWGAPLEIENHQTLACKAAIEMKNFMKVLNSKWASNSEEIKLRIGINAGEVVVGNIGGMKRFDYTVMGDNVNLTSRLEGANKIYGSSILISEEVARAISDNFIIRELDTVRVKGKSKPTKIFELVGLSNELNNEEKANIEAFSNALSFYKRKEFSAALNYFNKIVNLSDDKIVQLYIARCEKYIKNPPSNDWDYVITLTEK